MRLSEAQSRIIAMVGAEADLDVTEMARRCGLRVHTARYALDSMYDRGIISKLWVIDMYALGWSRFNVMFSIGAPKKSLRQKLINTIVAHEYCTFFVELGGNFDYEVSLACRRTSDALQFFHAIARDFGPIFTDKQISAREGISLFPRKYLADVKKNVAAVTYPRGGARAEVDEFEHLLLRALAKDGRRSLRDIARELGVSATKAEYHFKRLRSSGVIVGCVFGVNNAYYGATSYELHLFSRGFNATLKQRLFEFARRHPNCTYFVETFGHADYEIGVEVKQYSNLVAVREEIGELFGSEVTRMEVFAQLGVKKYSPYPFQRRPTADSVVE